MITAPLRNRSCIKAFRGKLIPSYSFVHQHHAALNWGVAFSSFIVIYFFEGLPLEHYNIIYFCGGLPLHHYFIIYLFEGLPLYHFTMVMCFTMQIFLPFSSVGFHAARSLSGSIVQLRHVQEQVAWAFSVICRVWKRT